MTTPFEEWEDFRRRVIEPQQLSETAVRQLRMVFVGALSAATDFYQSLLSGGYSPEVQEQAHTAWVEGLADELDKVTVDLAREAWQENGRNN
jgi:hypothetical protein